MNLAFFSHHIPQVYADAPLERQLALIGEMLKADLTYKNVAFRTPDINKNLDCYSLALNKIGLLEIEQPYHFENSFSSGGGTGRPLEHLEVILSIVQEIYEKKKEN